MKKICLSAILIIVSFSINAQTLHTLSMEEYEKAKTFAVKDLDNDSYVKFENTYVLDRYEGRKPYFITGDDGNKKRQINQRRTATVIMCPAQTARLAQHKT